MSEPQTVGNYYNVAHEAANNVLEQVIGKKIDQIVLNELIRNEESNKYLTEACEALEQGKYFKCLVNVRKAIYIEIEQDYCIYEWGKKDSKELLGFFGFASGGRKAPNYTKDKAWIEKNVSNPFDFIQRDHDHIRQDLLEWGASTQDFWNLWRLTPEVMRLEKDSDWLLKGELKHLYQAATKKNATFCLDRAVTLLAKKQSHHDLARWLSHTPRDQLKIRLKDEAALYDKATSTSNVLTQLQENSIYDASAIVPELGGDGRFVNIFHLQEIEPHYLNGYIDFESCEVLKHDNDES